MQKSKVAKTLISSALLSSVVGVGAMRARRTISAAPDLQGLSRAVRQVAGRRSYAQTPAESLLFFSCCSNAVAVPVDSRRHCTDVAIHSSLGGQQWRRRERKQRNRRRSVGRRSSLRRFRSSALLRSKIASHGPAHVDGETSPKTGRPSDRRRASAGRRFKLHDRCLKMRW